MRLTRKVAETRLGSKGSRDEDEKDRGSNRQ